MQHPLDRLLSVARLGRHRGAALLAGALLLAALPLHAQIYIPSPDNDFPGSTYFEDDTEVGGNAWVDYGMEVQGGLQVDDSVSVTNDLYVTDIYADNIDYSNLLASQLTITGNLDLTSGSAYGMPESWGMANSWLHAGLDLGDLTYAYPDTPAFNISENTDGTYFYPTIYFTGYADRTTWVWQENGIAAMNNWSPTATQMTLADNGDLTVYSPYSGHNILFDPEAGSIQLVNDYGSLVVGDGNASTITINATGQSITFYNGTTHAWTSIAPESTSLTFTTTSSGQAYGASASATASYAFALGHGALASGNGSFAIGNNVTAAYDESTVLGAWNAPISGSGSGNTTWVSTDPLFVIGNGTSSGNTSNALVMLKNGDTTLNGNLTVSGNATFNGTATTINGAANFTGNVTVQPQGDILMGNFNE